MNSKLKVGIVDYGAGNIRSITNALAFLDYEYRVIAEPKQLHTCNAFILPGVGAFAEAMKRLNSSGLADFLQDQVTNHGKPLLGICLGLQLLGHSSTEDGYHKGLGWIDAVVDKLPEDKAMRVPMSDGMISPFRTTTPCSKTLRPEPISILIIVFT